MRPFNTTSYRMPNEHLILMATVVAVTLVIALTATATVCLSAVFILGMIGYSYYATRAHHQSLLAQAASIIDENAPALAQIAREAAARLQVEPVHIFAVRSRELNAYTFGLSSPKAVVLNSPLLKIMDPHELQFIIGHEMGHVKLGHTWLNSLMGGMAGIPAPSEASLLLVMAFRWWNRSCEMSADRAGLLACGSPEKAISSLVKLHAALSRRPISMEEALATIEAEDDSPLNNLEELLLTHPMAVKRINQIREYAASSEYRRLQEQMDRNLMIRS